MRITSATFVKSVIGTDELLENGIPQVAFIGRSNAGKSTIINSLTGRKNLAKTSASPGKTKLVNLFLINKSLYLIDLPGYGYASASKKDREWLRKVIDWYLFKSQYEQKCVVLIIDASVGPTANDLEMLDALEEHKKNVVVVANKMDKIRKPDYKTQLQKIQDIIGDHLIIPYSSKAKIGMTELTDEILK